MTRQRIAIENIEKYATYLERVLFFRPAKMLKIITASALVGLMTAVFLPSGEAANVSAPLVPDYDTQKTMMTSGYYDLHQATTEMDAGHYEAALPYLNSAVEKRPASLLTMFTLGVCYFELAQKTDEPLARAEYLASSERVLLRARSMRPDMMVIYFKLGKVALLQDRSDAAIQYYSMALEQDDDSAVIHFNLASVYDSEERYAEALTHYEKSVQLDPAFIYSYNNMGLLYELTENPEKAEAAYKKALASDKKYNYARLNLGNLYASQKKFKLAMQLYEKAKIYEPANPWPDLYLGNVHFENENFEKAVKAYGASIKKDPSYAMAYYLQAVSLKKLNRNEAALAAGINYMQLAPKGRYARETMVLILTLKLQGTGDLSK